MNIVSNHNSHILFSVINKNHIISKMVIPFAGILCDVIFKIIIYQLTSYRTSRELYNNWNHHYSKVYIMFCP